MTTPTASTNFADALIPEAWRGKAVITVDELIDVARGGIPISRSSAYRAIEAGQLPSVRLGERRVLLPVPALMARLGAEAFLHSETAADPEGSAAA